MKFTSSWSVLFLETSRPDIIKELNNNFKNLKYLDNKSKLIWLMFAEDKYIYEKLYKLLDNLFTLRQEKIDKCNG